MYPFQKALKDLTDGELEAWLSTASAGSEPHTRVLLERQRRQDDRQLQLAEKELARQQQQDRVQNLLQLSAIAAASALGVAAIVAQVMTR